MTESIYALSLWQPWASLLVLGEKEFETRAWPIPLKHLPRKTAIHAASRWTREQSEFCERDPFVKAALLKHQQALNFRSLAESKAKGFNHGACVELDGISIYLPLGCLIGVGGFVSCWPTETLDGSVYLTAKEKAFGNYAPGRFAFRFHDPQRIIHTPMPGRQRWWRVDDPGKAQVLQLQTN